MKRLLFVLAMVLFLLTLAGCSGTTNVLYEGVLLNIVTVKGTTTMTFVDKTVVTKEYNTDYNSEGAIILGDTYSVMERTGIEDWVYLVREK